MPEKTTTGFKFSQNVVGIISIVLVLIGQAFLMDRRVTHLSDSVDAGNANLDRITKATEKNTDATVKNGEHLVRLELTVEKINGKRELADEILATKHSTMLNEITELKRVIRDHDKRIIELEKK